MNEAELTKDEKAAKVRQEAKERLLAIPDSKK